MAFFEQFCLLWFSYHLGTGCISLIRTVICVICVVITYLNIYLILGFKAINVMCPLIVFYWIHYIDNTYTALVSDHQNTYSAFERENNLSLCLQENELRPAGYCYIAARPFFLQQNVLQNVLVVHYYVFSHFFGLASSRNITCPTIWLHVKLLYKYLDENCLHSFY